MTTSSSRKKKKTHELERKLYFAITENDIEQLEAYISGKNEVNLVFEGSNQWHKSAMHLCCEQGHLECARLLLEAGADVDQRDDWYQTPLMYSISTERSDMVEFLLQAQCLVDLQDRFGKTALHFAVGNNTIECMKLLIEGGTDINCLEEMGKTPLWLASTEDGKEAFMRLLVESGCDVNKEDRREGRSPLQAALHYAHKDTMTYAQILIKHGASVNRVDHFGQSSMTIIIRKDRTKGQTINPEHMEIAKMLLDSGYNVNLTRAPELSYQFHGTSLKAAVERGSLDYVVMLLDAGADPDIHDNNMVTPLLLAVSHNYMNITKVLLSRNCKMDIVGNVRLHGMLVPVTPFYCAVLKEHFQMAELLVLAGYNLQKESYLLTNETVPDSLVRNFEFWGWLHDLASEPQSLQGLCRTVIRARFGTDLGSKVDGLPLPPRMKDYVMISGLLSIS